MKTIWDVEIDALAFFQLNNPQSQMQRKIVAKIYFALDT